MFRRDPALVHRIEIAKVIVFHIHRRRQFAKVDRIRELYFGQFKRRHVLDIASGSGLVAIAAARAGAASVTAGDIDPGAISAVHENAMANGVDGA